MQLVYKVNKVLITRLLYNTHTSTYLFTNRIPREIGM